MKKDRLHYLDISKGFAILLLLFSHTAPNETINTWIFIFHMPIFFIIGGILLNYRANKYPLEIEGLKELAKKRIRNLVVPYLIFGLILCVFYAILAQYSGNGISYNNFYKLLSFQGIDSLWFIPCYFWSEILLFTILSIYKKSSTLLISIICIVGIVLMSLPPSDNTLCIYITKVIISLSFFAIGFAIQQFDVLSKISNAIAIVGILICSIVGIAGGFSAIGGLQFPYFGGYFPIATFMSLCILRLFKTFENCNSIFETWGQYSIVVLCTNNLIIEIVRLIDYRFIGNLLLNYGLLGCLIFWIILIIIERIIIKLAKGPLAFAFGK